jgi:hypothetical protein
MLFIVFRFPIWLWVERSVRRTLPLGKVQRLKRESVRKGKGKKSVVMFYDNLIDVQERKTSRFDRQQTKPVGKRKENKRRGRKEHQAKGGRAQQKEDGGGGRGGGGSRLRL